MFLKSINRLRRNTAVRLTLRFATLFLLSAALLFVTVDFLLSKSQLEKDQLQISSFLESYQRLEDQAGLHKLELVIERDAPYFQRSEMRVAIKDSQGKNLILIQPESWQGELILSPASPDETWQHGTLQDSLQNSATGLIFREVQLADGLSLSIGKSAALREAQLSSYRGLVLLVMLPLLLLGLLLTAYMNWHTLRPLHDLIDTVRSIQANQLKARVDIRNPDSELGELAKLFNDMLAQIQRLIDGMRHSLDSVAHDLRTPLSRMRLSLESALTKPDEQALKEALMDCAEESQQIEAMLKTLMDLSEAESGILKLHKSQLNPATLIEECIELYDYVAEEKSIRLNFDNSFESTAEQTINADPIRLRQALANLLDNAIKYTPEGGLISVKLGSDNRNLNISIKDSGIGITAQDQPLIFDRLFRAQSCRSEPGMGLGLSLVKAIIEAHKGSIRVDSDLGKGSCFSLTLPLTK
ncbi:ATP-binding protein [Amphritea sp. HPY]|uniref:sensor histidine kinase n=1 Tax=Amphritea sp. HPY TaxID=3421652 RepID=UPI003D7CB15B